MATLDAARGAYGERVLVAFQPHRFSRTEHLFEDFARFHKADTFCSQTSTPPGKADPGGHLGAPRGRSRDHGHHQVRYVAERADIAEQLVVRLAPGTS